MTLEIRKMCKFVDTTYIEDYKKCEVPVKLVSVAAVISNPWVDQGYVDDLKPAILEIAPKLGDFLVAELLGEIGSADASALIHTLHFGNKFRDAVGGTSYLSFTNVRGLAASKISIPMMHKTDPGLRQFYLTHEFTIHDAPGPGELVIAIGASETPQAHHRIGNRYEDEEEMKLK